MAETIQFYLLPETALRQAIELCRAVGLEPQFFEGLDAECDAEVWTDVMDSQALDEKQAKIVLDMLQYGLRELHKNLRSSLSEGRIQLNLNMRPSKNGTFTVSTPEVLHSFQSSLLLILAEQSKRLGDNTDFNGISTHVTVKASPQTLQWSSEHLMGCGWDNARLIRNDRKLGAHFGENITGFLLNNDLSGFKYGIENFGKKVNSWKDADAYPWQNLFHMLNLGCQSGSAQRPALVYSLIMDTKLV